MWNPTKPQLEILAEHAAARTSTARMADAMGVDEAVLCRFLNRLAETRTWDFAKLDALFPMPAAKTRCEHAIIAAERHFEQPEEAA